MKRVNLISLFGQSVDVGLRFGGNVCITVGLCALEVPLKQQRCWGGRGGGGVDLSVQWGGCDVVVENGRWCWGG